jgi:hypothetical protein
MRAATSAGSRCVALISNRHHTIDYKPNTDPSIHPSIHRGGIRRDQWHTDTRMHAQTRERNDEVRTRAQARRGDVCKCSYGGLMYA